MISPDEGLKKAYVKNLNAHAQRVVGWGNEYEVGHIGLEAISEKYLFS
jgi:hypothetical protein